MNIKTRTAASPASRALAVLAALALALFALGVAAPAAWADKPHLEVTSYSDYYDGQPHSASVSIVGENTDGYHFEYRDVNNKILPSAPTRTDVGTSEECWVWLKDPQNTIVEIESFYICIWPRNVTVKVAGESLDTTYDGDEKSITGYTPGAIEVEKIDGLDTPLYTNDDYSLKGGVTTEVTRTNVGRYRMGLTWKSFVNNNDNFNATFKVTDGVLNIAPRPVTFMGESNTVTYNRQEQSITGITPDGLASGHESSGLTYCAKGTNAGNYEGAFDGDVVIKDAAGKDVTANYEITKTPGVLTISPVTAQVTVTVKGNSETLTYDGDEHSVEDYKADADNTLYNTDTDFSFDGKDTAHGIDADSYYMGLESGQFANKNKNFTNVKFVVEDGFLTIEPLRGVVLTIKGNSATHDYDGKEHSVEGFTAESSDPLFTEADWYFDGEAVASGTKVGTYAMGLAADQFSVASKNFADVTFDVVEDGELEILAVDKDDDSAADEASVGTPRTGDATNALLPVGMIAVAGGAMALAMRARRRGQE